jgi:hypothetical protein
LRTVKNIAPTDKPSAVRKRREATIVMALVLSVLRQPIWRGCVCPAMGSV